jgi:hypothetical protein
VWLAGFIYLRTATKEVSLYSKPAFWFLHSLLKSQVMHAIGRSLLVMLTPTSWEGWLTITINVAASNKLSRGTGERKSRHIFQLSPVCTRLWQKKVQRICTDLLQL